MFFDQNNTSIKSTTVYTENFTPENKPVFLQVTARTLHKLVLKSRSYYATMQVDDLESSYVKFFFLEKNSGAFSLVSNNRIPSQGGYRYVRLSSGGNTILEIDFTKLKSVNELEKYFDAYY